MAALAQPKFNALLEREGFRIRGRRADCPYCEGSSRLTVSVGDGVAYCHRCHRGISARALARQHGQSFPAWKPGQAYFRKKEFAAWLARKYTEMANAQRTSWRRAKLAKRVLLIYPDCEPAWGALSAYYQQERALEIFFTSAHDHIGRYWLYRSWRAANAS